MEIVIKSKSNEHERLRYPYMGADEENKILIWFTEPGMGILISTDSEIFSKTSSRWAESNYTPVKKLTVEL